MEIVMLLTFRATNFRSLRDEQELSLNVSTGHSSGSHAVEDGAESSHKTLPLIGLYGANASGKSNVLWALLFMADTVCDSYQRWKPGESIPVDRFSLDKKSNSVPARFEVEIVVQSVRYTYGFCLDDKRILQEWLYAYPVGRRQVWYERDVTANEEYYFGKNLGGRNRTIADLTRPNSLFLSAAAANNHAKLYDVYHWFLHHLRFVSPQNQFGRSRFTISLLEEPGTRNRVVELLKAADFGIRDVYIREESLDSNVSGEMLKEVQEGRERNAQDRGASKRRIVEFEHSGEVEGKHIPLTKESLGTQAWFAIIGPLIRVLDYGDTLLIDELDASLHPTLSSRILQIFRDPELNPTGAQLIFTTHDTALLGNLSGDTGLQREEVWFTEKDSKGATTLFPLSDFSPRKLENLERGYLQGRYGAVPFIDSDHLRQGLTEASPGTEDREV